MARTTTTVTYNGTEKDKAKLARLAQLLGTTVGAVTRGSVDAVWGEELERLEEIESGLFDSSVIAAKQSKLLQGNCKAGE